MKFSDPLVTGLLQADAVALPLADDSVDLVVTSPPYFALRSYRDGGEHYDGQIGSEATPQEFLDALWAVTAECVRVLKPSGSLWVNLGDKYSTRAVVRDSSHQPGMFADRADEFETFDRTWVENREAGRVRMPKDNLIRGRSIREKSLMGLPWRYAIGCIDDLGLILRAELVWSKPNGLPESVTDRVRRSHEQWFHFTLEPRYFSAIDEIREPQVTAGERHEGRSGYVNAKGKDDGLVARGFETRSLNPLGKLPGSVWSIPSEPLKVPDHLGVDHFAAFPQEWPRRLILGWCPAEVCTACGEGRVPVTDRTVEKWQTGHRGVEAEPNRLETAERLGAGRRLTASREGGVIPNTVTHTITGYACACPDTTAPSTPGVVLDPFAGTGTVPMVARALGRIGIGVDLSGDYLRLAKWRVFESGHASKTVARTNGERQGLLL